MCTKFKILSCFMLFCFMICPAYEASAQNVLGRIQIDLNDTYDEVEVRLFARTDSAFGLGTSRFGFEYDEKLTFADIPEEGTDYTIEAFSGEKYSSSVVTRGPKELSLNIFPEEDNNADELGTEWIEIVHLNFGVGSALTAVDTLTFSWNLLEVLGGDNLAVFANSNTDEDVLSLERLEPATIVVSTEQVAETIPRETQLHQNYPNPVVGTTHIPLAIAEQTTVVLKIYDTLGREVETLIDSKAMAPGTYRVEWQASEVPAGVYFYRLDTETRRLTRSLILVQ